MSQAIQASELRQLAGHFATGVAVVTTRGAEGEPYGLTVNALASLSLQPPLYLVCVDESADSLPAMLQSRVFAINILTGEQEHLSRAFASKDNRKFENLDYRTGELGMPLLERALATAGCRVEQIHQGGDHMIFVGRVEAYRIDRGKPLLFYRGSYAELRKTTL